MDDDRLKEMRNFRQNYFDESLERIRDIRTQRKGSIKRLQIFMPRLLTTIQKQKSHNILFTIV